MSDPNCPTCDRLARELGELALEHETILTTVRQLLHARGAPMADALVTLAKISERPARRPAVSRDELLDAIRELLLPEGSEHVNAFGGNWNEWPERWRVAFEVLRRAANP